MPIFILFFFTLGVEWAGHWDISCHTCACHMQVESRLEVALHLSCLVRGSSPESDSDERDIKKICHKRLKLTLKKKTKNNKTFFPFYNDQRWPSNEYIKDPATRHKCMYKINVQIFSSLKLHSMGQIT